MPEGARNIANDIGYCEHLTDMATLLTRDISTKSRES